jgi:hypothetical protein
MINQNEPNDIVLSNGRVTTHVQGRATDTGSRLLLALVAPTSARNAICELTSVTST